MFRRQQDLPHCRSPPIYALPISKINKKEGTYMYYIYALDSVPEVPVTAERLLRSLGVTGRLTGFAYAVFLQADDQPKCVSS